MPDLLSLLKLANIFSPSGQMTPQQFPVGSVGGPVDNSPMQQSQQQPDLMAAIQGLLQPRDEQFNNYSQLINSMPQRADYQPSKFRQIAAAIAGLGAGGPVGIDKGAVLGYKSNVPEGLKIQSAITDEPYNKALSDWSMKVKPSQEIAQMEQTRNVGNRATALGTLQRQQAQEKIDQQVKYQDEEQRRKNVETEIKQERADAYVKAKNFTMDHPQYKPFVDEDGNLVLYNPQDPTAKPIDTGVKKLSDMEKIDLQVQGQLKVANARAAASKDLEGVKQANRKETEGIRQINRIDLKTTPSGNVSIGKPLTPAATATDKTNKAIEIINARPELSKFFVMGGNKKPTGQIQVPKDADPKDAEFINQQMGASDIKLPSSGTINPDVNPKLDITQPNRELTRNNPSVESPQLQAARKKLEAGYVLITRDGGKTFAQIPASNVNKLKPELGYVVVK